MPTRPGTGTRQGVIRRHNLGTLLLHLHRDGPLLRAQLTERMQLNRSTVGALVSELEAMGAVSQEVPTGARDGAGRPSLRVQPRTDRYVALAAQLQVNDVTVARVGLGGAVLDRTTVGLPPGRRPDQVAATVTTQVAELAAGAAADATVVGLGVSVPGLVGRRDGLIRSAPNLGWTDTPFAALLTEQLAARVPQVPRPLLSNDADLGALAEQSRADSVVDDLVYLSGDVGVGGGLFVGGAPVVGVGGYAGELGHIRLREGRRSCRCGGQGCWETEIGAVAVAEAIGCPPSDLDALPRLLQGLGTPTPALVETGRFLGEGLGLVTNMLNPRRIILGGLLADLYPVVRQPCDEAMQHTALTASREQVELALPTLGHDSVLLGAAELAFAAFFADPASWAAGKAAAKRRVAASGARD